MNLQPGHVGESGPCLGRYAVSVLQEGRAQPNGSYGSYPTHRPHQPWGSSTSRATMCGMLAICNVQLVGGSNIKEKKKRKIEKGPYGRQPHQGGEQRCSV